MSSKLTFSLNDLQQIISRRIQAFLSKEDLDFGKWLTDTFGDSLMQQGISWHLPQAPGNEEWTILMLALVPHLKPNFFEPVITEHLPNGGDFPEFGGAKSGNHRGMLPTGETALFILAGNDPDERIKAHNFFSPDHFFYKNRILWLEDVKEGEPRMSGRIILSNEWMEKMLYGRTSKPHFSAEFPAKLLETQMTRDDMVLHPHTSRQIDVISAWLDCNDELMKDGTLSRRLKPGYKVLFYGPSGTGKTLAATLIGKEFKKDVYRIDLSQIVSKYIGETEKNLERIFARAENHNWILFFDEADALFGKRTSVDSSHDRYANQEVSYLLQRVEDFPGLLILATNFKHNIDAAFSRRFNQVIHFPLPDADERLMLWNKTLPGSIALHPDTNIEEIAHKYEITGAAILNVVQYASLQAIKRSDYLLHTKDIIEGIRKEFQKEERYM